MGITLEYWLMNLRMFLLRNNLILFLRYVNKEGKFLERFLGIAHVKYTLAKSLKEAIYSLLLDHPLSRLHI